MKTKTFPILCASVLCFFLTAGAARAVTPPAGEEALFTTSTAPDALILLDLSGSMDYNPAGGDHIWGNTSCSGTSSDFYHESGTGHTTNCSRLAIAKRALFDILDDNDDNTINGTDETSLGVRIGYMRFYNCGSVGDDSGTDYASGCNKLIRAIASKYSLIYCASSSSCSVTSGVSASNCVNGESANGGTPLAGALNEARLYLDAHKAVDSVTCRQKFAILITDGADTFSCNGSGTQVQSDMYKRRRETVAKTKALADAGYKVFVIGFGAGMPAYLQDTLNWMAYYGKTDNPNTVNEGSPSAYSIVTGCDATTNPSACCNLTAAACYPSSVTSCGASTTNGTCDGSSESCFAESNDPGNTPLTGYAFLASDADQLAASLKTAINIIREATYSFSQSSIQSSRTQDENFIYEGSFQPIDGDPFWRGHFKKYSINTDGTVNNTAPLWDAGLLLQSRDASGRTIYTYKSGARADFTTANLVPADLGITDPLLTDAQKNAQRDAVVGYIRGASTPDNWKLGDVFRATPITVGTPSAYFDDFRDASGPPNAFATHRANHVRLSTGLRIVLAGANDGQLHAFRTGDGSEAWGFIPPNQLPRLKLIAHAAHPTSLTHQYFVDGPVTVADAWIPATAAPGTSKAASDWHTLMIFGEGRGGNTTLWSSSTSCDSGFSPTYSSTYQYYCGYYCFDLNASLNGSPDPVMQWTPSRSGRVGIGFTAAQAPYVGAPWSKMMVGRVMIGGNERWVGFIGGGVYTSGSAQSGKGFFVVDLYDGSVLWSFTRADNSALDNPMPAPPAVADTDNDGFIDTAYLGDLGSNMWRFKFCLNADGASCGTTSWTGGIFFQTNLASGNRPIYTSAAVAKDPAGNLWVYWGTGDKTDPTNASAQEKFIALKDNDRTTTYTISNVQNITSEGSTYNESGGSQGYYLNLTGQGEKMLAEPTVFGGVVYFTTYTPPAGNDPCEQGGVAKLYGVNYQTGGAALPLTPDAPPVRTTEIGTGIASAAVISLKPAGETTPDLYVTTSGGGGTGAQTQRLNFDPPGAANRTNMLYWKDKRVEQ
ncbi:MAG: pilus assembly protein [Syntrophales bacterium]